MAASTIAAMSVARVPVLWICGPPGAGKTTAGWAVYSALARDGVAVAYADIDQLGMCYPEPASDPGRHRMKTVNLAAVIAGYAAAGTRCVVVSGVTDPVRGADAGLLPRAELTVCHLRASVRERARRLASRDGRPAGAGAAAEASAALPGSAWRIDTTTRSSAEVAALILARWRGEPDGPSSRGAAGAGRLGPAGAGLDGHIGPEEEPRATAPRAAGEVLLICGPTGVGKSAVGYEVYQRELRAGRHAAYVDLDQVGVCSPGPAGGLGLHMLRAGNLAALWQTFRAAGASLLVTVGPVGTAAALRVYADSLPGSEVTACRLHAGPAELTRRIMLRGAGHGWAQPGDPLAGRPATRLGELARDATAAGVLLEGAGLGAVRVDTTGLTIDAAATAVAARARAARGLGPARGVR